MTIIYEEHNQTYGYRRIMDEYNETHDTKYNKKRFHFECDRLFVKTLLCIK